MKKLVFSVAVLICSVALFAQNNEVYVVTGANGTNYISFDKVRVLDIKGQFQNEVPFTQANLLSTVDVTQSKKSDCTCDLGSTNYIAAMTVDKHDNLVCMSLLGTNIFKYENGKVTTFQNNGTVNEKRDEKLLFARMATTPDGNIYALNNIGSELLKIDADNNTVVSLGEVNGFRNIFSQFSNELESYGGDMIADSQGNIYVFTAFGHIVKIDLHSQTATYVGQITNLPENFTVNGVSVLKNNQIVLGSARPNNLYVIDINNLKANYYADNNSSIYDMASKNFLQSPKNILNNSGLSIVPTVVKQNYFNIVANSEVDGLSQINIYNLDGKLISSQSKHILSGSNNVSLDKMPSGIYLVKVINGKDEIINTTKIEVY